MKLKPNTCVRFGLEWVSRTGGNLVLELGPGGGEFALGYATAKPMNFLILVERSSKHCRAINGLRKKLKVRNLMIINGLSERVLPEFARGAIFSEVHMYYPSVYVAEQGSTRLFDKPTMSEVLRLSNVECSLFLKSDKHYVLDDVEKQLHPYFLRSGWINPFSGLSDDRNLGTGLESAYSDAPAFLAVFKRVQAVD